MTYSNRVLKYNQSADFLIKKAEKLATSNNFVDALPYFRKAAETEPNNIEYKFALAEVYTEMNRFEDSNSLLFAILKSTNDTASECYFGMGCNFMGLNDFDRAEESFDKYLDIDPEGEYAADAYELLEILDATLELDELKIMVDANFSVAAELAEEGKELLDSGKFEEALNKLLASVNMDKSLTFAKNNLALAYYCTGDLTSAIAYAQEILDLDNQNIHANCNMAIFMKEKQDDQKAEEYINKALNVNSEEAEDLQKIAYTLCELKEHERARTKLKQLLHYRPYDIKALFCMAVAGANTGKISVANKYFTDIIKIEPHASVARYYKQQLLKNQDVFELSYVYQVPYNEIVERIKWLNDAYSKTPEELLPLWQEDEYFVSVLTWGLSLSDTFMRRACIEIIAGFSDSKAKQILQAFLLRREESDENKNLVFYYLNKMGVEDPFIAYLGGEIVEVRVQTVTKGIELPPSCLRTEMMLVSHMKECYKKSTISCAIELWNNYLNALNGEYPRICKATLWAATFEYLACEREGISKRDIANYYELTQKSLLANVAKIKKVLNEGGESDGNS